MRVLSSGAAWILVVAVVAAVTLVVPPGAWAQGPPTIDALAWVAGSWEGAIGEDAIAEHWLPPAGGEMIGVFRWLKGGKVYLYELMSFEPDGEGVVLRIKHFGSGLVGREAKDESVRFELVEAADGTAVFADPTSDEGSRLTYRRLGASEMTVTLTEERAGTPIELVFRYRRATAARPE